MITITFRLRDVGNTATLMQYDPQEIDEEINFAAFQEVVEKVTKILPRYQHVTFDNQVLDGRNPLQSLPKNKHVPKLTLDVEHRDVEQWVELKRIDEFFHPGNNTTQDKKKEYGILAQEIMTTLNDSHFFEFFSHLVEESQKIHKRILKARDLQTDEIESSVKVFFEELYRNRNPQIGFSSKGEGSRRGVFCTIVIGNETINYHIKTHHDAGNRDTTNRFDIDLKELFVYKLLQKLKVGAEVKFIPHRPRSGYQSQWVIYIASCDLFGFRTLKAINKEAEEEQRNDQLNEYKDAVTKMLFIYSVLNLGDHHSENMGVNRNGDPYIVDFMFRGQPNNPINVEDHFHKKIQDEETKKINELLASLTLEDRLKIAQQYLKDSDFVAKVDETLRAFLDATEGEKQLFDGYKLVFQKHQEKTEDLKHYVKKVMENAEAYEKFKVKGKKCVVL